jgi:hypothetical protein
MPGSTQPLKDSAGERHSQPNLTCTVLGRGCACGKDTVQPKRGRLVVALTQGTARHQLGALTGPSPGHKGWTGGSPGGSIVFKFCFYKECEIYRLWRGRKWCNLSQSTDHVFRAGSFQSLEVAAGSQAFAESHCPRYAPHTLCAQINTHIYANHI